MGNWAMGIFMSIIAILGLFLSSGAADHTMQWVGLLLAGFGIAYNYSLIIRNTGH
ncbi:hypothetical protein HH303_06300 [Rhodospirillaceae bacterium KN72]|uniref:Uncharacterized protein n=1 Tax=Pacificispira spongiicola TaxID=2729598 RepID=A0A7Y0HG81_9PROT|nr:hypothetical protein [Pacificispira spongiicola]NMM44079.1 hypothetical protein [Pacificispira spongiicola]